MSPAKEQSTFLPVWGGEAQAAVFLTASIDTGGIDISLMESLEHATSTTALKY